MHEPYNVIMNAPIPKSMFFSFLALVSCSLHAISSQDLKELYTTSTLEARIVFVGDSLVWWGPWNDLFARQDIANRGIGGNTSADVAGRINDIFNAKPQQVFIIVGINDIYKRIPTGTILTNYAKVVQSVKAHGAVPVILSTPYINPGVYKNCPDSDCGYINTAVTSLNDMLKNYASNTETAYIDINSVLTSKVSGSPVLDKDFTTDGVHLNLAGYRQVASCIGPSMQ